MRRPAALTVLHVPLTLDADAGGPPVAVRGLAMALREHGVQCEIATTRGGRTSAAPHAVPGIAVHAFPLSPFSRAWNAHSPQLARFLRRNAGRFDLVHVHELWHHPGYAALQAARRAGVGAMLSIRGALAQGALQRKSLRKNLYMHLVQRRLIRRADAIHALSSVEADAVAALGTHAPIFQQPNGVAGDLLAALDSARPDPLAQRHPQLANRRVILFLGRINALKGLMPLAHAFIALARRHDDIALLVAGAAEDDTQARAAAALAAAGMRERAVFAGMLTGDDKLAALRLADIFVLPSAFEGFSNAILEALAAALPVVISAGCNFPEAARHQAGRIAPTTPEALADAIGALLRDAPLRARMGANGRRLIERRYAWPAISAAFAERYRKICDAKRAGRAAAD